MAIRQSSSASGANSMEPTIIPMPTTIQKRKSPKRRQYYGDQDLYAIISHLAVCLGTAEGILATFRQMKSGKEKHRAIDGSVQYWENVCSAIRWVALQANKKQSHILEMTVEDYIKCLNLIQSDCVK